MPAYKYTQKDGSTKWYANFYYVDWTGERKHKCKRGFKTQREAKEYERNFLNQEKTDTDILFSNFIESYLEDMDSRLKPTTMEGKRYIIQKKLLPYFGKLKIKDITSITVRKWQNEMMAYRDNNGKPYSKTYLKTMNNQLSAMLNYAVKHYSLPSNPCRVAGSMGKSKADEMNIWTKEQFDKFIVTFRKPATRLAFNILFYTGIRVGELLALTPADILPDKRIDINKNFARSKGEDLIMTPKTDKSYRSISIPDFLFNEIQQYISSLYEIRPDDRIFYFTKSNMEHEIKRGAARAGIPVIRVHDLRHSHASMLIDMGFDILEISRRLGHESTQTTWDTYGHLYPDSDRHMADELEKINQITPAATVTSP